MVLHPDIRSTTPRSAFTWVRLKNSDGTTFLVGSETGGLESSPLINDFCRRFSTMDSP